MRFEVYGNRFFGSGGAGKKRWIPIWIAMVWAGMGFSSGVHAADVVWNFGSTAPGTTSPTSGTPPANLTIAGITQGTIATTSGSGTSPTYTGNSAGCNIGFAAKAGVLDITAGTGSAYFEFILTPASGYSFLLSAVSFGSRSTSTGPKNLTLRSSVDNYASEIGITAAALSDSSWGMKDFGVLSLASSALTTFRIYGYNGTGSGSGNWRVDDVKISVSDISGPVVHASGSLNSFSTTSGTPSGEQILIVSGYNLGGDLTVAPPAGFEIKTAGDYTSLPLTILRSGGSVTPTTVTIRVAAATPANPSLSGNVTVSSSGASDKTLAVSGTVLPDTSPFISVSTNALPAFSASSGSVSASQSFTTAAKNLTNEFTVTAPGGFQVSTNGLDFTQSLTLAQTNGLSTNTVSVRVAGTNSAGSPSGNVVLASAGATSANVAVTATVTDPTLTLNLNPALMYENATSTGTVTLPTPRIADLTINLNSGSPTAATVPPSVILYAGQTSVNFTVTGVADSASYAERTSLITASATNCTNGTATITVLNADLAPITPISLDGSDSNSYSQNFNGLGTNSVPRVFPASNGVQVSLGAITTNTVNGWYGAKIAGTGTSATDLLANAGTTSTGTLYSFGITNDVNRALGTIATGTTTMAFGALIKNDTGGTITNVKVSFTAEFWRSSTASSNNVLTFGYGTINGTNSTETNFLTTTGATPFSGLNITGPAPVASNGALDGNLATNQVAYSNVALPLTLGVGETAFLRWQDLNDGGDDAGIGMDNFVLSYEVNGISNSAPTQIGLSATAIAENNAVNDVVGTLSTTDSDVGDSFTYTLASGTGDADNASFNISGSSLRASVVFDYETKSNHSIRVRTTDSGGGTFEKVFTITVTDVNETPADTTPPVITLIGDNPHLIANGAAYVDLGAAVTDNVDANRTITGTGTVNTAVAGDYTITYNAADAAGNVAIAVLRTVRVAGPVVVESTYADWSGGAVLDSVGLSKYAIGGASSLTETDGVKPSSALSGGFLVITAIVRTDNSSLTVVGQAVTDLANYASGTGVTTVNGVETTDQTGVPTGHKRKTFSVAQGTDARKFMRLSASLALSGTNTTVSVARDSGGATFLQVTGATAGATSGGTATSEKRTVYYFAPDSTLIPSYTGTAWPYVIVQGQLSAGAEVTATLSKNSSGVLLVNGLPAYQFGGDSGSTTASGVSGAWPAMRGDGTKTTTGPSGTIQ
jgi:hypothetical protein